MRLVNINIDINKLNSQHPNYDPMTAGLCVQAVTSGATIKYNDNGIVTYMISDANIPMILAKTIVSLGLEVKNYPFFIKVELDTEVPVGIPNREYEDENGDSAVHTWRTWKSDTFEAHEGSDGATYISAESNTGALVTFNLFSAVFDDCIDNSTFKSLTVTEE